MKLTKRQREVLRAWLKTTSQKQAAFELGISEKTIQDHLVKMKAKLGIVSSLWLAIWAVRNRVVKYAL
jgi:DNA-binding NarL/FixJ family response regulator